MRDPYYRLYTRWLPELGRFRGREDGERAIQRAWKIGGTKRMLARGLYSAAAGIVGVVAVRQMDVLLPLGPYAWLIQLLVYFTVLLALGVSGIWITCRQVQRSLRWQLHERGIPICVHCGYDLTGNVSGVCPECGTPVPPQEPVDEE